MTQGKCLYHFDNKELFDNNGINTCSICLNDIEYVLVLALIIRIFYYSSANICFGDNFNF